MDIQTQSHVDNRVEAEVMAELVRERELGLSQIDKVMRDVRELAVDMNTEIHDQGDKLMRLDSNFNNTGRNVKKALDELSITEKRARRSWKRVLCCLLIAILIFCYAVYRLIS